MSLSIRGRTQMKKALVLALFAVASVCSLTALQAHEGHDSGSMGNMAGMNMHMGPMNMSGAVTMNGKTYDMKCDMQPLAKSKAGSMSMDMPMKMSGTMTMMGHKYRCNMSLTPKS